MSISSNERTEVLEAASRLLISMVANPNMKITSHDEIGKKAIILLKQEGYIEPFEGKWRIIKTQIFRVYNILYRSNIKEV